MKKIRNKRVNNYIKTQSNGEKLELIINYGAEKMKKIMLFATVMIAIIIRIVIEEVKELESAGIDIKRKVINMLKF